MTDVFLALVQGTTAVPKAVAKLIDTVGDQIGLFLEPSHIRRKGQAEADVDISHAVADAQIATIKIENKLAIQDIKDRATERARLREEKRQINLEAITGPVSLFLVTGCISRRVGQHITSPVSLFQVYWNRAEFLELRANQSGDSGTSVSQPPI